jgi:hypothetical protein
MSSLLFEPYVQTTSRVLLLEPYICQVKQSKLDISSECYCIRVLYGYIFVLHLFPMNILIKAMTFADRPSQ